MSVDVRNTGVAEDGSNASTVVDVDAGNVDATGISANIGNVSANDIVIGGDLDTVNAREAMRPGRFPGTATTHFDKVHAHACYDVEVDTAAADPHTCAEEIAAYVATHGAGQAFALLRRELNS